MFCMLDLGGCSVWRLVVQGLEFRGLGFKGVCASISPHVAPNKDRIWAVCALLSLAGGSGKLRTQSCAPDSRSCWDLRTRNFVTSQAGHSKKGAAVLAPLLTFLVCTVPHPNSSQK